MPHPVEIKPHYKRVVHRQRKSSRGYATHRYTRLQSLFDGFSTCFNDADCVHIIPLYNAGEDPIDGIDSKSYATVLSHQGTATPHTVIHLTN